MTDPHGAPSEPGVAPSAHPQSPPPRGVPGCLCGTPPFAPPEPAYDCPFHGYGRGFGGPESGPLGDDHEVPS